MRASKTDRVLAERAQIILACGQGLTATEVAERLSKRLLSVQMWRRRYLEQGVSGLEDRPRSGRPRKLSHANVRAILKATVERIPRESTYWSVRLMAEHSGVSKHQVAQIWKAADLKPHRVRNFKISNDPHFAEKVIDVVGLYMDPPDNALVLSVDEKTEIQALDRTQPMLPLRPGQIQRRTHDYKRHGTASLYAAFDVVTGEVMGRITNRHRAKEFLAFLRQTDQAVEPELDVHLILDNSSTHKTKQVQSWLAQRPRYHLHFTPTRSLRGRKIGRSSRPFLGLLSMYFESFGPSNTRNLMFYCHLGPMDSPKTVLLRTLLAPPGSMPSKAGSHSWSAVRSTETLSAASKS